MTAIATRPRCDCCEGYGYVGVWWTSFVWQGMPADYVTMRRCPYCRMRERERLAWIAASKQAAA